MQKVTFSLRITQKNIDFLKMKALKDGVSISELIENAINEKYKDKQLEIVDVVDE